ncbi:hypothetical protein [Tepidibacillus sp. HK-1]|uniref:hypothetical protein n=1 Tax=Tepidibacillus sp. HK-1 TaxID=1883407 RepID=UPI0015EB78DD|nr:hypothetical protein [Tepidibacillus sp. HK-1]
MLKKLSVLLLFLLVIGCSNSSDEQSAMQLAKEFKMIQYEITDYTHISDLTERRNTKIFRLID